ncbi:MAG TPA: RagB/SusD family nutrient uptake outer membrane protein [Chitinophagales bacterium]|nr:RagB/SusD family nutrient uptake outer membrane protein [Chitinophagales bacterium]
MKIYQSLFSLLPFTLLAVLFFAHTACEIDEQVDPNGPSMEAIEGNATIGDLNNVVTGIEAGMRNRLGTYFDGVGVLGREWYRFSGSDPRFTSDLLGKGAAILDDNTFYTTASYAERYRIVRNCNILINAVNNTTEPLTQQEKNGYLGFAKTVMAYQLLLVLNQQYSCGIRVDVANPDNLGPFLGYDESLQAIQALFAEGQTLLSNAGDSFVFSLSSGFSGFGNPDGFLKFNRALAARVAIYQGNADAALTHLSASFMELSADSSTLYKGIYHPFSTAGGDQLNELFYPLNSAAGANLRAAHPSYIANMEAGDHRIWKVGLRTDTAFQDGLQSKYDFFRYRSLADPIPIIRNEELVLIYAEASNLLGRPNDVVSAINLVRSAAGLPDYNGGTTQDDLRNEILRQRRYSLYGEGHRWIDVRRYNLLNQLPKDRPDDDVWINFPRPATENQACSAQSAG